MNAFVHPPNRNLFLVTLTSTLVLVASLLPLSGAESKSKKSSSKSAASSTPKAKKSSSESSDTAAAQKAKASPTPQKKPTSTASATPKKASSNVAKATPASTKKRGKSAKAGESAENKKSESQTSSTTERSASTSSSQKTGISGQPSPALPQSKPAAENEQGSAAESSNGDTPGSEKAPAEALTASIPTPPSPPVVESKPSENAPATNGKGERRAVSPNVSLDPEDLLGFDEQPIRVQQLIKAALDLAKQKLTYTYGSADPANGGMDCSGAIHHLLTQQGFKDVPRDASGQYVWARKTGKFFAVVSKKADSFEFGDLLPGDILFWNGTYKSDRDPPVTHTMIYLGVQRKRAQHVMWGSSDGRTYDGKPRWGVSVFDFKMPRADKNVLEGAKADFLGYARIPGLRE